MPGCMAACLRYGAGTTCFSLETPAGIIVVDAGTGICSVARELRKKAACPPILLLFTHLHMDHIIGLPGFAPLYRRDAEIELMADPHREGNWKESLRRFVNPPYWPVGLGTVPAGMRLVDLPVSDGSFRRWGVRVEWYAVPHPQQCLSYRLTFPGVSVVIATDVEYAAGAVDEKFVSFCHGADALIFDAQYRPGEYAAHRGWGHSTWEAAAEAAVRAGVKRLILTHHAPDRSDREVDRMVREARRQFSATQAAREGMVLGPSERTRNGRNPR
jgi:phosphoribosyl 1,2-cyclic phosphodiesterase